MGGAREGPGCRSSVPPPVPSSTWRPPAAAAAAAADAAVSPARRSPSSARSTLANRSPNPSIFVPSTSTAFSSPRFPPSFPTAPLPSFSSGTAVNGAGDRPARSRASETRARTQPPSTSPTHPTASRACARPSPVRRAERTSMTRSAVAALEAGAADGEDDEGDGAGGSAAKRSERRWPTTRSSSSSSPTAPSSSSWAARACPPSVAAAVDDGVEAPTSAASRTYANHGRWHALGRGKSGSGWKASGAAEDVVCEGAAGEGRGVRSCLERRGERAGQPRRARPPERAGGKRDGRRCSRRRARPSRG